jgi:hypothetical protein
MRCLTLNKKFKNIFLHAGAPKTGTTAFQAAGVNNFMSLQRAGILYPVDAQMLDVENTTPGDMHNYFMSGNLGHICGILCDPLLDLDLLQNKICEELATLLNKDVKDCSTLVLSSENVMGLNEVKLAILIDVLKSKLSADGHLTMLFSVRNIFEHAVGPFSIKVLFLNSDKEASLFIGDY